MREIIIEHARENNLKDVSLRIPHYRLIAVTGVSGSGKTSLVHDVLCAEGQRLFFENFAGGRQTAIQPARPKASRIDGLFPVMAIGQESLQRNPRSTVGTLTEIYDLLRLLFARLGTSGIPGLHASRSLFSFNLPDGWCPACKGLGEQDHIDTGLLIGDPSKTIREGAFVLTTPNNYIIYSQVTMAVLDEVCRAEGFSVDIPWQELTDAQKSVVLNGSTRIKVLFGKHPLESRLKWTGITAKPREEDYYKGILTVMEDILRRERNPNIMRFARSHTCTVCGGKRLNGNALSVKLWDRDISEFALMSLREIDAFFTALPADGPSSAVTGPVREAVLRRTALLLKLGAGHLTLNRESPSLSGGESRRIRLANQAAGALRNVLYILDEPSTGLHPSEHRSLLDVLRSLVASGNTVMLVDHDEQSIREADWIIDIGPGAGTAGGEILYNGPAEDFFSTPQPASLTLHHLSRANVSLPHNFVHDQKETHLCVSTTQFAAVKANQNNLRDISPRFRVNAMNVITGVSGSGKTSLINDLIDNTIRLKSGGTDIFKKVIHLDSTPIGRTPNSNPATYTGLSDHVRDLMASLPESKARGYKKGQFSFVVEGGRCESCGGAGVKQVGMHFLGNVEVPCEVCEGRRFTEETLEIRYNGLNIFEILELTVDEAHLFFEKFPKVTAITGILSGLGLGYLRLGQPSTTLSGGEAQRVKLASELSKQGGGQTLYILDEPTTGLHMADTEVLIKALKGLIARGHTLLCIEHDPAFILQSDWMVDLGPGSAAEGGTIVAEGPVAELIAHLQSLTAAELRKYLARDAAAASTAGEPCSAETISAPIRLLGVETNNLKNIDASFPVDAITAVTGVSGSGKSSLVYGTLWAESQRRFIDGMPSYSRRFAAKTGVPVMRESLGLVPAIALQKKNPVKNPRSTIATYTGLYDLYRLLFSRLSSSAAGDARPLSSAFSFNGEEGACPECRGLGTLTVCDPSRLITNPDKAFSDGALNGTKTGKFYGDPFGQYVAALLRVGELHGIDFTVPFDALSEEARRIAIDGCGDVVFDVEWKYKRGTREGVHRLKTSWPGFCRLVETEYVRKHADERGEAMLGLMKRVVCPECSGLRLKKRLGGYEVRGLNIGEVSAMSAEEAMEWFGEYFAGGFESEAERMTALAFRENIGSRLEALMKAGLGYIATNRIVGTLSGGEFQRLQLAGLVRAPLTGVAYILDEPSFGLHPDDTEKIAGLVADLKRHGNSVILVDHSPVMLSVSDYVIELGPGAGVEGGMVVYEGRREDYKTLRLEDFKTGRLEDGKTGRGEGMEIHAACANNLKDIDVDIPAGEMTVITGVSGSGKTSLLDGVIYASHCAGRAVNCASISGFDHFESLVYIGQQLPGKGQTATVGSMLSLLEPVAKAFAASDAGRAAGFRSAHFTPGAREGRCPDCEGAGVSRVSMDFFSDAVTPCERCGGTGFRDEVLEVRAGGKTIYELLQVPMAALVDIPEVNSGAYAPQFRRVLELAKKTGLGHLSAGRQLKTLSTGELQRLKLVAGLASKPAGHTLFLLDEPTGGLHPDDTDRLISLFDELIRDGNTIVCVTHEPRLTGAASHVITLGPGGGSKGGRIVAC